MRTLTLQVEQDHVESLARIRNPLIAVEELIWNGLDADAKRIDVDLVCNSIGGLEKIRVTDKGQLGMGHYEARSWTSRHHHMSLVALAHLYILQTRRGLQHHVPDLTLDMAIRLLRAALPRPQLTLEEARDLIEYYGNRKRQTTESHRNTSMARHPHVARKT